MIIETNKTTARLFPEVPDCEVPEFWARMDRLVELNNELKAISESDAPALVKNLRKAPVIERFAANLLQLFLGKTVQSGSVDFAGEDAALSY